MAKVAPVIIFACKVLGPAVKLGVRLAGIPMPDGGLGSLLGDFSAFLDTPLSGKMKDAFKAVYGER